MNEFRIPKPTNDTHKIEEAYKGLKKKSKIVLEHVFGKGYIKKFREEEVIAKKAIDKLIPQIGEKGIILSGSVGVGKTMAMIYIYQRLLENEIEKAYKEKDLFLLTYDYQIFEQFQFYYMPDLMTTLHVGGRVHLSKYLFIDDFGTEYPEPFALARLDSLIEKYYRRGFYGLVLTTNLKRREFLERQNFVRITDRLNDMCTFIEISGTSRRVQK